jgi:hypothetical protein
MAFSFPFASVVGLCGFLFCRCRLLCVWSPRCRAGLPLPPLVCFVSGPVGCPGLFACFVFSCGRLTGLHDLLSAADWSGDGGLLFSLRLRIVWRFGPVWGTALYTMLCWRLWSLAFPSESASRGPTTPLPAP